MARAARAVRGAAEGGTGLSSTLWLLPPRRACHCGAARSLSRNALDPNRTASSRPTCRCRRDADGPRSRHRWRRRPAATKPRKKTSERRSQGVGQRRAADEDFGRETIEAGKGKYSKPEDVAPGGAGKVLVDPVINALRLDGGGRTPCQARWMQPTASRRSPRTAR